MDITLPVMYRGITLTGGSGGPGGNNPIDGFRLTRAQYSNVSVHGYVEKRSLDDGYDASDVYIGMREIELVGEVFAPTKAALFDYLDILRLKFTPTDAYNEDPSNRGYLPLRFSQPTLLTGDWPTGFVERVIYARPSMQPEHTIDFGPIGGRESDGYVVPFRVVLQAKDPRFYAPVPIIEPMSGTSGVGDVRNRGNYPAPVSFELSVDVSGIPVPTARALPNQYNAGETLPILGDFIFNGFGTRLRVLFPPSTTPYVIRVDGNLKIGTLITDSVETLRMDLVTFGADTTWGKVPPTPEGDSPAGYDWATTTVTLLSGSRFFFSEAWV